MNTHHRNAFHRWLLISIAILVAFFAIAPVSLAQNADAIADEAIREAPVVNTTAVADPGGSGSASINLLQIIWDAKWLMLPIIIMSILVVAVGIERAFALRRSKIAPDEIVMMVEESTKPGAPFSPKRMYQRCTGHPSPLSNVVKAILVKLGRPSSEVENIASETMQRETDRLYRNVRTLNLAAAVTPLIGLLGTVWGMIQAFFVSANIQAGQDRAEHLAEGIYTALITTAGGLVVAIPAAILAHYFEGQIEKRFLDIHELVYTRLMPQAERLEGRSNKAEAAERSDNLLKAPPADRAKNGSGNGTGNTPQPGPPPIQSTPS